MKMQEKLIDLTNRARETLTELFDEKLTRNLSTLNIDMDEEIHQEMKERVAALMFDELVNDIPVVPYLAVWVDGSKEIAHLYMSPKIENLLGYSTEELKRIGFSNIVGDDIFSFYREKNRVEEKVSSVKEVQKKRERGFLGNRQWEGFYKVRRTDGRYVWVIDRSTITKFRNSIEDNIICLSGGILLETTELMDRRSVAPG